MFYFNYNKMSVNKEKYLEIMKGLTPYNVQLVAVSKLQRVEVIQEMYDLGQRDFGENYVQELIEKYEMLPRDIRWHFIGHLQRNKVKYIAPFIHLIQGVDSLNLLKEINKEAHKAGRKINCLLQIHIAQEETKFGLDEKQLDEIMDMIVNTPALLSHVKIEGLMGMASFTGDVNKVNGEMKYLKMLFDKCNKLLTTNNSQLVTLSMGMSGDYMIAIEQGSSMVRIGSLLFGARQSK